MTMNVLIIATHMNDLRSIYDLNCSNPPHGALKQWPWTEQVVVSKLLHPKAPLRPAKHCAIYVEGEFSVVMIIPSDNSDDNLPKAKETKITEYFKESSTSISSYFQRSRCNSKPRIFPAEDDPQFQDRFCLHTQLLHIYCVHCHFLVNKERIRQFLAAKCPCGCDIREPRYPQSVET